MVLRSYEFRSLLWKKQQDQEKKEKNEKAKEKEKEKDKDGKKNKIKEKNKQQYYVIYLSQPDPNILSEKFENLIQSICETLQSVQQETLFSQIFLLYELCECLPEMKKFVKKINKEELKEGKEIKKGNRQHKQTSEQVYSFYPQSLYEFQLDDKLSELFARILESTHLMSQLEITSQEGVGAQDGQHQSYNKPDNFIQNDKEAGIQISELKQQEDSQLRQLAATYCV
ncbi:MAG: hypothetical protein EZS28_021680 [Streblomastix strix]|uniref:Uncharacterized protein n=1 Tax=Streblomastix strix TaxID=222440 RepID=A0A5J4VKR0_9EUKA|nr:MAG: hypothetical protein EZS28_021680 [Streblomastix strix]